MEMWKRTKTFSLINTHCGETATPKTPKQDTTTTKERQPTSKQLQHRVLVNLQPLLPTSDRQRDSIAASRRQCFAYHPSLRSLPPPHPRLVAVELSAVPLSRKEVVPSAADRPHLPLRVDERASREGVGVLLPLLKPHREQESRSREQQLDEWRHSDLLSSPSPSPVGGDGARIISARIGRGALSHADRAVRSCPRIGARASLPALLPDNRVTNGGKEEKYLAHLDA